MSQRKARVTAVTDGARVEGIVAGMPPGAIIEGTIFGPTGEPIASACSQELSRSTASRGS